MIYYTTAQSDRDLWGILELQSRNFYQVENRATSLREGYVTVKHDLNLLRTMNQPYPHIIAKNEADEVIAYALVMLRSMKDSIEVLVPMFAQINTISYHGRLLQEQEYFIMGQVCIDKAYRGKGVFAGLYQNMQAQMRGKFDYIITEVMADNPRSLRAHHKVGFENIKAYQGPKGEDWIIVLLNIGQRDT